MADAQITRDEVLQWLEAIKKRKPSDLATFTNFAVRAMCNDESWAVLEQACREVEAARKAGRS